jgi:hypothetical protein
MIKLNDELLAELDLDGLPGSHRRALLQVIYQELEMRVGTRLASAMTDPQLRRFEVLIQRGDEAEGLAFLNTCYPKYPDIVAAEFELLKAEIAAHAQDVRALCAVYADVPIEVPPSLNPWRRPLEAADNPQTG